MESKIRKFLLSMLLCSGSMAAEVVLPRIYTDNMVLQHDSEVLLPGKAVPG